jgi:hypothetical protein
VIPLRPENLREEVANQFWVISSDRVEGGERPESVIDGMLKQKSTIRCRKVTRINSPIFLFCSLFFQTSHSASRTATMTTRDPWPSENLKILMPYSMSCCTMVILFRSGRFYWVQFLLGGKKATRSHFPAHRGAEPSQRLLSPAQKFSMHQSMHVYHFGKNLPFIDVLSSSPFLF